MAGDPYIDELRQKLRECGFRFEGNHAIAPDGKRTYVVSSFDHKDLLEAYGHSTAVSSTSAREHYEEEYGEDLVDLCRRLIRQECSDGRLHLERPEDVEEFGDDLVDLIKRIAREGLRGKKLTTTEDEDDFGKDLIEMVRQLAELEPKPKNNMAPTFKSKLKNPLPKSSLLGSPFHLLGATVRDNRKRIVDLADEQSLVLDSDACHKARSDLTTPRNRISAELTWLPGLSPNSAKTLVEATQRDPDSLLASSSIPPLARANLHAAVIESLDPSMSLAGWAHWIVELAYCVEQIEADDVVREINEDRSISGFPEVKASDQLDEEIEQRFRYYTETIKNALNEFDAADLVDLVTTVVEQTTENGTTHAPRLIHEVVDRYSLEANRFLEPEADNIEKLIDAVKERAGQGEAAISGLIDKLEQLSRQWDKIAQPIQLSMRAQGLDHKVSMSLADSIRSLSVFLFNEHDMLNVAQRINKLLHELFAELPEMVEKLSSDADTLRDIQNRREKDERESTERDREITYSAEIGVMFKDRLEISPRGVSWKGRRIPLENITRVRWGAVRRSVNGIPTGTDYTMAVGDNQSEMVIETRKGDIFEAFTDKLWKAVCVRLMTEHLKLLKAGKRITYGGAVIDDDGIELTKHKFLGSERAYCRWGEVSYYSSGGYLYVQRKEDKKTYASISYMEAANTHILEAMIRLSFKNWKGKMSELLG